MEILEKEKVNLNQNSKVAKSENAHVPVTWMKQYCNDWLVLAA